jgi:uncharacterized coiled-coil DUF342 family protein
MAEQRYGPSDPSNPCDPAYERKDPVAEKLHELLERAVEIESRMERYRRERDEARKENTDLHNTLVIKSHREREMLQELSTLWAAVDRLKARLADLGYGSMPRLPLPARRD